MGVEDGLQAAAVVAAAAAAGRIITRRLPLPLPVFLLAVGLIAGTDGLGLVEPAKLGELGRVSVMVAVALIVFEGGSLLRASSLRRAAPLLRNLVIGGLVVTPVVGALAAHFLLGFPWRLAALFGSLVCVTGPSVIIPLLQAVRVNDRIRTTLMGEGVIIDPLGALLTLFLLEVAVAETFDPAEPAGWVASRLGAGVIIGVAGAGLVYGVARGVQRLTSREVSLLVLAGAIGAFASAESIARESGLTAMVVMGIGLGQLHLPHREEMEQFQESIASLLVATVYVLLAASIDIQSVRDLWPEGFAVVLILIAIGRPLLVWLASFRTGVPLRDAVFLAAVAPRGVVAASMAGVVAIEAGAHLGGDSEQFVALVFVVILVTIGLQSAYAGRLSRALRVFPMRTVVAGYGEVGRRVAERLREAGEDVLVVESDGSLAVAGREAGYEVLLGDIADPRALAKADVHEARALILVTGNDDRSLMAAELAQAQFGCQRILARVDEPANIPAFERAGVTVVSPQAAVASELAALAGPSPLIDIMAAVEGDLSVFRAVVQNPEAQGRIRDMAALNGALIVLVRRGAASFIPTGRTALSLGDMVTLVAPDERASAIRGFIEGLPLEGG